MAVNLHIVYINLIIGCLIRNASSHEGIKIFLSLKNQEKVF